jgi:hypothetical protein
VVKKLDRSKPGKVVMVVPEGDEIEDGGAGANTHGHHDAERGQLRVVLGGKEEQAVQPNVQQRLQCIDTW